jgi:hypothetical protein
MMKTLHGNETLKSSNDHLNFWTKNSVCVIQMSTFGSTKLKAIYERYTLDRNSLSEAAPVLYEEYVSPVNSLLETVPLEEPRTCPNCYASYDTPDSTICWNCGANLVTESRIGETYQASLEEYSGVQACQHDGCEGSITIGKCMVCKFDVKDNEGTAWCPWCGTVAHRDHFLEWLHVKHCCPVCGEHLNEELLRQGS